jgi:hypothetical protein
MDHEASLVDEAGEAADEDEPGLRLMVGERMQFQVMSTLGLVAVTGAAAFRAHTLSGLPNFCEHVRSIHRDHAHQICGSDHVRNVLTRALGSVRSSVWATLPAGMLLIRALLQIEGLYGASIRVGSPAHGGLLLSAGELSQWIVQQHVAAQVPAARRGKLLEFCDYVYMRGAASAGHHTGWAGRAAAMICASCGYSPFERDNSETASATEPAHAKELPKAQVLSLRRTTR